MSAFYPPSYSFTGINFNSGFFTTPPTGLTQTQANAIYLRKTTPDTASALETFTGGIKANTINGAGSSLTIGASTPSIQIGANAGANVVYISAGTGHVIIDTPLVLVNNELIAYELNTTLLTTSFLDQSYPDILVIGDTMATSVDIGAVAIPTNIKGALNTTGLTTATGGIKTNTIDVASASALDIGTTTSTSVNVAKLNVSLNVKGSMQCTQQVYPNGGLDTLSASALNIGTTVSKSGAINIGTGASRTGVIHIGDGNSVSGGIHIGNGTSASNNVNILNGATSTGSVNIGNNTSGTITIGGTGALGLNGASITINQALTPSYSYPLSGTNKIGAYISPTVSWTMASYVAVATSVSLPVGVYHLDFSISTNGVFVTNFLYLSNALSYRFPFVASSLRQICSGSYTFTITTAQTISLFNFSTNAQTLDSGELNIYRIA